MCRSGYFHPVNLKPFSWWQHCRRSLWEILTMTFSPYLSSRHNLLLAAVQVHRDGGKYSGGILMRTIEGHLYFTLLSPPPTLGSYFRTQTSSCSIFRGRRLIPLDSVVNLKCLKHFFTWPEASHWHSGDSTSGGELLKNLWRGVEVFRMKISIICIRTLAGCN